MFNNLRNVVHDRILSSPLEGTWQPLEVVGSFYKCLRDAGLKYLEEEGDWDWLTAVITGDKLSARQGLTYGKKFAVFLRRHGFRQGDIIHLVTGNFNLSVSACFGTWILGGICSMGDVNLEDRAVAKQLKDLGAKIVLCTPEYSDLVRRAVRLSNKVEGIANGDNKASGEDFAIQAFCFGEASDGWCPDLTDELEAADPEESPEPFVTKTPKKETAIIFWTSGTTGHPKGICHSHHNALNFPGFLSNFLQPRINFVTSTCFFHVGGFYATIWSLMLKQCLFHTFGTGLKLEHILNTIVEKRPKTAALGTHHYVQLAESDILAKTNPEDLSSLEMVLPAGAAVPASCEDKWKAKCPNLQAVANGYGQTESGVSIQGFQNQNLGIIYPGVRIKIEDLETGKRCGPGKEGEICVKSTFGMMLGYYNRVEETKKFFDFEGFGHTGDMGYYDEDGNIIYVDRLKELMKYQNNFVAPTELEAILQKHPAVKESLVFGQPDPKVQEIVTAVVVRNPGIEVTEAELCDFVNNQVTDFKRIRGGIIFRKEIPRNSVGKLVRRQMREWAKSQAS